MVAIIDYDAGNIKSVEKALQALGENAVITRDKACILEADKVILPGVGAFGDAMQKLEDYGLTDVIREVAEKGTPFLGICLGLQLLFERSEESEGVDGLGILPGEILRIPEAPGLKIPPYRVEFLILSQSGAPFYRGKRKFVCLFCPFLLSEVFGSFYCYSGNGIRHTYSCFCGKR